MLVGQGGQARADNTSVEVTLTWQVYCLFIQIVLRVTENC